jgi:DNA repair exonuclease SbcCD ATPase subunit
MIKFKVIRWKNFLSTGNIFTELDLCKFNTSLIVGRNGSGKSTVLDALTFALFGKPFRKINKPQLMNSITRRDMVVEIEFDIGTNLYKIVRGIKPNIFEIYQNGELVNQSSEIKDYQEVLEKNILKVNYKSFCQVVVLGSATFQPFMQLSAGQRRDVIEDLLDLQIFTTMNSVLKNKIMLNGQQVNETTLLIKSNQEKIDLVKEHLLEIQNNNEQLIEEKRQRLHQTDVDLIDITAEYGKINGQIVELSKDVSLGDSLKKKLKKLETYKHQINAKISILNKDISFLNEHNDCPTCKQSIEQTFKESSIKEKNDGLNEIQEGMDLLVKQMDELTSQIDVINNLNDKINSLRLEESRLINKITSLKSYIKELEKDISSIEVNKKQTSDVKISDLEAEYEILNKKQIELSKDKTLLSASSLLLKDSGIKAKIIKQYVPIINKLINKYLTALDFFIQFELNEEFDETIRSRYRDDFSYSSFSEGEKQKINLAILFTWRAVAKLRNSINTNLLIMDEIFDSSLDNNSVEHFFTLINGLNSNENLFVISHKENMIEKFDNIIRFKKTQNFSTVI